MRRDVTYLKAGGSRWNSLRGLSHWLAIGLGGALLLALLLAQSVAANHGAAVTGLTLTGVTESVLGFTPNVTSYMVTMEDALNAPMDEVTVRAKPATGVTVAYEPEDADANVEGHQVSLAVGENTITVVATSVGKETMRTYTVKVTRISAANANLSTLSLGVGEPSLSPVFDPDTASYVANVANDVEEATVTVVAMPTHGSVTPVHIPEGPVMLAVGDNVIRVVTTSVDGTQTKTYTVTVTKAASDNAMLSSLELSGVPTLAPPFVAGTTSYTANVANSVGSTTVTAMKDDPAAEDPVITPGDADTGTSEHQVNLAMGANTITVMAEAADGSTETYTVVVTRDPSDADLDSLTLTGVTADVLGFNPNVTSYTVTVSDTLDAPVDQTTVVAVSAGNAVAITPGDADDTTTTDHEVDLAVGANTITVTVTKTDSTSQVYTVKVTRIAASNASLRDLSLGAIGATLSPAFNSGTTAYTASVANEIVSTTVTGLPTNRLGGATVVATFIPDTTEDVALATGDNIIRVVTTSVDGTQTMTYTVTVTRAKFDNAMLSSLELSGVPTLAPPFVAGTTSYTANVENSVERIIVTAMETVMVGAKDPVISPDDANALTPDMHEVDLMVGKNTITVMVEAEDGSTETYTVTVTRAETSGAGLSALSVSEGTPIDIQGGHPELTFVMVEKFVATTTVTAIPVDLGANVAILPPDADADTEGHQVNLDLGDNEIIVMVTSSDGSTVATYTVDVFRKYGGAALSELTLSHGTLNPAFDPGIRAYTASVAFDLNPDDGADVQDEITVSFEAADNGMVVAATVVAAGATPADDGVVAILNEGFMTNLEAGGNLITVTVGSSDATARVDYTVNVFRVHRTAQLTKLSLGDDVSLSPALDAGTTYYMAEVDYDTTAVTVTTEASAGASVAVMPADADAEAEGHQVALAEGANTIMVEVSHGEGDAEVMTPYMVVVERPTAVIVEVEVEVPGPTVTVTVPGPTVTRTVTETVTVEVPAAAASNVVGGTVAATATEVNGQVMITRHDGGASLVVNLGGFIRDDSFGQTYQVVRRMDGAIVRQWVSPNSPLVYQIPWAVVNSQFSVPVGVIGAIPLDDQSGAAGQLVRRFDGGDDRIFSYDGMGGWRHVPDIPTFQALGLYWCDVTAADAGFFDRITIGSPHAATDMPARSDYPSCSTG